MIVCPDKIRENLYGDESIQGDGKKVFEIAYAEMYAALKNGINVIFDATNINKRNRKNVLKKIKDIKCRKWLYYIPVSVEEAVKRQEGRERKVPLEVVQRMYGSLQEPTISLISGDVRYETAGSLLGGKRIWLLAKLPQYEILGDAVDPFIVFTNSHDGTGAIKVACTPTRVCCNNTLNLALKDAKRTWSTRHMGDMQSKLDEAKRALELADEYIVTLGKEAEMLANVTVNFDMINTALDKCFPVSENDTDRKKNRIEGIKNTFIQCYGADDITKFSGTAWGAVNAMADMVSHPNAGRKTASFQENNWGKIIDGRTVLDDFTSNLLASAGVNA